MEFGTKYNEVMEHVHTDEAMRERILGNIEASVNTSATSAVHKKGNVVYLKRWGALAAMLALVMCANSALACTTFLVGKEATADGSTIATHNDDSTGADFRLWIIPSMEGGEGIQRDIVMDSHNYGDDVGKARQRAYGEYHEALGAMCKCDDRQLQLALILRVSDGVVLEATHIGAIADVGDQ